MAAPCQRAADQAPRPRALQTYELGRINPASDYDLRFNIEPKIDPGKPDDTVRAEAMTRAFFEVFQDAGMTARVTVQSFDWRRRAASRCLRR